METKRLVTVLLMFIVALMFQGCSWVHIFQIENTTSRIWNLEYEVLDDRGLFKKTVKIIDQNSKDHKLVEFENDNISIKIEPKQTLEVGWGRSTHYKVYKEHLQFDSEIPWRAFLNVERLRVFNTEDSYELVITNLNDVLSKNSRSQAVIDISRVVEIAGANRP